MELKIEGVSLAIGVTDDELNMKAEAAAQRKERKAVKTEGEAEKNKVREEGQKASQDLKKIESGRCHPGILNCQD